MRELKKLDTIHFEDLAQLQEYQQKMDFFTIVDPSSKKVQTFRLPIIKNIVSTTLRSLHGSSIGDIITVDGYLEYLYAHKVLAEKIFKFAQKNEIASNEGFKTYEFYAESSKVPTDVIVLAPSNFNSDVSPDLPYTLKFENIGRIYDATECKSVFLLKDDPKPTILKIPKIDAPFPILNLKDLRKGLSEVSSLSVGDEHVCNSLLSPFVGSDFFKKNIIVDGIGSSFIQNDGLGTDVQKLNDLLKNSSYGLSLEQFGVLNISSKGLVEQIDKMRGSKEALQKLRVLSWNMPTSKDANNLKLSEFKYKSEPINIEAKRDILNNVAFQHSLAYYALLKNKTVQQSTYDEALKKILDYVSSFKSEGDAVFERIIDNNQLPVQIGRIASFYAAFDTPNIVELTKNTIETGVDSTIYDVVPSDNRPKEKTLGEENIPLGVWAAIFASDRTHEGIIEKFMSRFGWSQKRAEEQLRHLHEKGRIISPDGVHYRLLNETKFNLKGGKI